MTFDLTPREQQVWRLLCDGNVNKEIGHALGISVHTAEKRRNSLYRKLGCHNLAQVIAKGFRSGFVV